MATKTKTRRERWFWEEVLEPEDGHLTPLGAAVGAAFGIAAFFVGRYVDSTLEDREALLARHWWETQRQQAQGQAGGDERGADAAHRDDDTSEADPGDDVPTYDQSETWINPDGEGDMTATTYDDGPPMTAREVAEAVAEDLGITPDEGAGMVRGYLDKTSERVGVSVHNWTLDETDVEAITSSAQATTATATAVAEATTAVAAASIQADEPAAAAVADEADSDGHVDVEAG